MLCLLACLRGNLWLLGEAAGLSCNDLDTLCLLADMYDVGKLGVIALSSLDLAPVTEFIRQHHDWWDGNRYPQRPHDRNIHILSRILAIADAYDAMTSDWSEHPALPLEKALKELEKGAAGFEPAALYVLFSFIQSLRAPWGFPPTSF